MRAYLDKHGMGASMTLDLDQVEIEREPEFMPDAIRGWQITIRGKEGEAVHFQGDPNEMKGLIFMMVQAVERMAKREAEEDRDGHRGPA